jgi:hypothetical protein
MRGRKSAGFKGAFQTPPPPENYNHLSIDPGRCFNWLEASRQPIAAFIYAKDTILEQHQPLFTRCQKVLRRIASEFDR